MSRVSVLLEVEINQQLMISAAPWGKAPVLEVNNQPVTQHVAITRYLAKQAGLCGANPWEDLRIDEAVDVINDLRAGKSIPLQYI